MQKVNQRVLLLAEGGIMLALASVLSMVKLSVWIFGGSITLLSMLPIVFYALRHGIKPGLTLSFAYGLLQFGLDLPSVAKWGLSAGVLVTCIVFDYLAAFGILGLAGLFRKRGYVGQIVGIAVAVGLRFCCHFITGVTIWREMVDPDAFGTGNPALYSLLYNGSYMLPELITTVIGAAILLKVPVIAPKRV